MRICAQTQIFVHNLRDNQRIHIINSPNNDIIFLSIFIYI